MKLRRLFACSVLLALVLVLLLPAMSTSVHAGKPPSDDGILFEPYGPGFVRAPTTQTMINVVTANLRPGRRPLVLETITVIGPDGEVVRRAAVGKKLGNLSDKVDGVYSLQALLGFKGPQAAQNLNLRYGRNQRELMAGIHKSKLNVDLRKIKPDVQPGDSFTFKIVGDFRSREGSIRQVGTLSIVYEAALPAVSGWYPGDGHIHTAFSDADLYSVDERAFDAAGPWGLKWIIMTDHPQQMDLVAPNGNRNGDYGAGEWALESNEVATAQSHYGIAAMNGEEISTIINPATGHDGHYLGYGFASFFNNYYNENNNPLNLLTEFRDGQTIINDLAAVGGFGIIAHPFWAYPWDYWGATGYTGLELTSGVVNPPWDWSPRPVDATTEQKWVSLLDEGKHVVGVANSDSHVPQDAYGKIITYLYIPNWDGLSHSAVYDALKNGRAVASEQGSLTVFTATTPSYSNPVNIGDTLYFNAAADEPITLDVESLGASGRPLSKIRLYSNYATSQSFAASKTSIKISQTGKSDYPYPPSAMTEVYYRVEADFKVSNREVETVYTNPIWAKPRVVLDFEDLVERQFVGTHYPGLTFSSEWRCADHDTGLYNTWGYPPHSGSKVVWTGLQHSTGTIWFDSPVRFVEAWFSAGQGVTMEAYDATGGLVTTGSLGQVYWYSAPIQLTVPWTSSPISYIVVHDSTNYWQMDDFAYGR